MAWDFETEPEFQAKLDWVDEFVREKVEPLDLVWPHPQAKPGCTSPRPYGSVGTPYSWCSGMSGRVSTP